MGRGSIFILFELAGDLFRLSSLLLKKEKIVGSMDVTEPEDVRIKISVIN